jgi:hypothetical protein
VEHRFTDTQDGTSAGAWWAPNGALPESAWMFDEARQVLIVTTRAGTTTEHRIVGKRPIGEEARRAFLPGLALHITRRVTQSRK